MCRFLTLPPVLHRVRISMVLALCLIPAVATAQQVQILHRFTPSPSGPSGALVQVPDGSFYGPLRDGGGGIVRLAPGGQVTIAPGPTRPQGRLVLGADGVLYGAARGWSGTHGEIFRVDPVTLETRTIHVFTGANEGRDPVGGLVQVGGRFFGVTYLGPGEREVGTLFRFDPATGAITTLHEVANPSGPLARGPDGWLYGTSSRNDQGVTGTIFRFDPASGALAIVHQFTEAEGSGLAGPLLLDTDGRFYGALREGGPNHAGTIFRLDPASNGVQVLYALAPADGDGHGPGPLIAGADGHLYGTAASLFRLRRLAGDEVSYETLRTFDAPTTGLSAGDVLTAGADGLIYGVASTGGPASSGTLYRFDPAAAVPPPLTVLYDFRPTTAFGPSVPAAAADGFLYGTTLRGTTLRGAIYRVDKTTGAVTILGDMPGAFPGFGDVSNSALVLGPDNLLYGTSSFNSPSSFENHIVRVDPVTGIATAASVITGPQDVPMGSKVYSGLVRTPNGALYGLRREYVPQPWPYAAIYFTFVFQFDPMTNVLTDVAQGGVNGASDLLAAADGRLYLTTQITRVSSPGIQYSHEVDLRRVNLASRTIDRVLVFTHAISAGTPVQRPGDAGVFVAISNSSASVLRVDADAGTTSEACALSKELSERISVAPDGTVIGTHNPYDSVNDVLWRCDPVSHSVTSQTLPRAVPSLSGPLVAIDDALYGVSTGDQQPGGALVRFLFAGDLPQLDSEGDGLPNAWEITYGLDPFDASGDDGSNGDPDHDGRTNAQELADGTHPRGFLSRAFAEGATGPFFRTRFDLVNPSEGRWALVRARFFTDTGAVVARDVEIEPSSQFSLDPAALPGLANATFSTIIESDVVVGVDRLMTWDASGYGSHLETGVAGPATIWHFAEGSTSGDFSLFYLLQNPNATAATATVRYLRPAGQAPIEQTWTLPPNSRTTIPVDAQGPELASTDVAAVVTATAPIVAERAMYFNRPGQPFAAGHESAGITAPALEWFFAEGATGVFFDLFVLLSNPGAADAAVDVDYLLPGGGTLSKSYAVPADSRRTIWVDDEQIPAGSGQKPLANVTASMRVRSTNGVPIVAERTMWWPGPAFTADFWYEAHNSPGATATATRWVIGGGDVDTVAGAETFVLIANPTQTPARVAVTVYASYGRTSTPSFFDLPPKSRTTVPVGATVKLTGPRRVGVLVESLGVTPVPIVVERASYASPGGVVWGSGGAALASPLP